jgi:hypothetical protein
MPGESRLRENCTSGSEGRAEAADSRVCHLPRPDSDEGPVMGLERRGRVILARLMVNREVAG